MKAIKVNAALVIKSAHINFEPMVPRIRHVPEGAAISVMGDIIPPGNHGTPIPFNATVKADTGISKLLLRACEEAGLQALVEGDMAEGEDAATD